MDGSRNDPERTTWNEVSWRRGWKGRLTARFAALRIRIADGDPQRILDKGQQHMPCEEAWLVGYGAQTTSANKYYLSNLSADTTLKALAAAIKCNDPSADEGSTRLQSLRWRQGPDNDCHAFCNISAYTQSGEKGRDAAPSKPTLPFRRVVIAALSPTPTTSPPLPNSHPVQKIDLPR